jgi:hypothetical protein
MTPKNSVEPAVSIVSSWKRCVKVLNTNGYWNPVYDAEVLPDSSTDGYYVANPSTALVHVPAGEWIITRKVDALRSLLQYSELASSETVARGTAVVPMEEGSELYPSDDGASVGLYWRSSSFDLVRDAYIGVSDMPRGVWYEGQYVTQSHQTSAHVPWDYRFQSPSDHTESGSCTIGNNTYSLTRWANYRILDSNTTVDVSIENGSSTQQMYPLGGPGGVWSTYAYRMNRADLSLFHWLEYLSTRCPLVALGTKFT